MDRRHNNGSVKAVSPRHCPSDLCTAQLLFQLLCWTEFTKTMSVAPLLTNNLDNSKQKTSNLLSPAPPPYSWSLLGKVEGPAPPPSSKISWSFDLAWNPASVILHEWIAFYSHRSGVLTALAWLGATWNCHRLGTSSVYTIQTCTMSLHAKPQR